MFPHFPGVGCVGARASTFPRTRLYYIALASRATEAIFLAAALLTDRILIFYWGRRSWLLRVGMRLNVIRAIGFRSILCDILIPEPLLSFHEILRKNNFKESTKKALYYYCLFPWYHLTWLKWSKCILKNIWFCFSSIPKSHSFFRWSVASIRLSVGNIIE